MNGWNAHIAVVVLFMSAFMLHLMFVFAAPRMQNGHGDIPTGCTVLAHMRETLFGAGEDPVCFVPGAVIPGTR